MTDLRLLLLLFGAAVIAAVYVWTHHQSRTRKAAHRTDPASIRRVIEEPEDAAIQQELERMQRVMDGQESSALSSATGTSPEQIYIISVVAAEGQTFSGSALQSAFDNNDLQHGEKGIFHRLVRLNNQDQSIYALANMVKPGDFGNGDLRGFMTPGVTLILQLPGPMDSVEAFDDFMQTAERLAVQLGGQLHDQKHRLMTHQALMQKREKLAASQLHVRAR